MTLKKQEKLYQVWKNYGYEGWQYEEFNTFTECVDYIKTCGGCTEYKITKSIEEDNYFKIRK